jgi:hypothetical protein
MLKKSVAITLMMLYVVTVSGFALNMHYCFNQLRSVKIDAPANSCAKLLASSKMKCCKDRHIEIKVKDAHHQAGSPTFWGKFFFLGLPVVTFADFSLSPQNPLTERLQDRGPPLSPGTPIFLKNCNFRI